MEQRKRWNREAGRAKSNRERARKKVLTSAMTLGELDGALGLALTGVLSGRLEPGVGSAAASIARAIVVIRTTSDLEARLERLEAAHETEGRPA